MVTKLVIIFLVAVFVLFFLSVISPMNSTKKFWILIRKIRKVMDITSYWFFKFMCNFDRYLYRCQSHLCFGEKIKHISENPDFFKLEKQKWGYYRGIALVISISLRRDNFMTQAEKAYLSDSGTVR